MLPALLVLGFFTVHVQATAFFTTTNAVWKMFKGTSEASSPDTAAWRQRSFNDATWQLAPSPIFYSTSPTEPPFHNGGTFAGTTLSDMMNNYTCVFLRIPFVINDPASVAWLNFDVVSDDGFIAWINGVEMKRQNVGGGDIPFNGVALGSPTEPIPVASYTFTNSGGLLVNGTNILAIQALNRLPDSSDFGFMATLASSIDDVPPTVASLNPPVGATVRALTQITVVFSEPVTNITATDLRINGAAAASVSTNAANQFVFEFPSPPTGAVMLSWAPGQQIRDLASNAFAGGNWSYTLDTNVPPVSVTISEFMAANGGSLLDEDGESSDWIEIYNPGPDAVALDGWFLTDNATVLNKWRFPATNLTANSYLLVFASGKNRLVPGARLHTNFKLGADGSYLALVRPDGVIASEFSPAFPPQQSDVSYGISREVLSPPLLAMGAAARVFVPSNGALGLAWTGDAPFDDSAWLTTVTGIGYDQGGAGGGAVTPLGCWTFDDSSNPSQAPDTSGHNHHGTISGAAFTADAGGRSGRPGDRAMNFGPCNNGAFINVTDASTGWFDSATTRNAVTFALWIFGDDSEPGINSAFHLTGSTDGGGVPYICNAHLPWEDSIIYWDTGGYQPDQRVSILQADSTKWKGQWNHYAFIKDGNSKQIWQNGIKILDQSNTDPLHTARSFYIGSGPGNGAWSYGGLIDDFAVWDVALSTAQVQALAAGATPLDLDTYAVLLGGDIGAAMRNRNASAFVRIPFVLGAIDFDTLLLRMRYDDGYVCWLNGVEIASRNAPGALAWNSAATTKRTKNEARTVEEINVSAAISALRTGTNILAFQALNSSASDAELLLLPELVAVRSSGRLYFTAPTPGTANGGGVSGFVADTHFSADRGFYFAPTNVLITSATPGAFIVYTRDGTVPTPSNGTRVNAAESTLAPTATVAIATTTLLRAAAFKDGWRPTDVDTHTYLFPEQVVTQTRPGWIPATWPDGTPADFAIDSRIVNSPQPGYTFTNALLSIPTLSIVTPSNDLFSAGSGIYANAWTLGLSERAASAELIFPDGRAGFQINCGIRMHGNSSRDNGFTPKHSFGLLFREVFGPAKLDFPLFTNSPGRKFDQLVLRGCSTDSWPVIDGNIENGEQWVRWTRNEASYMRDQWMRDAQLDLGHASAHGIYAHLYLDGLYWGIYNVAERPDDTFAAAQFGGQREEFDVISDVNDLHSGTFTVWNEMFTFASGGLGADAAVQRIQGNNPDGTRNLSYPVYPDITNLIDYMILHIASGADDWPGHNWWTVRRLGTNSEGFRFFSWDQEITNNSLERTRISNGPYSLFAEVNNFNTPAYLYSQLRANAEFRVIFGDRVHRHLFNNGQLCVATNIARWQARHNEIDRAMVGESARWGDFRRPSQPYKREVEWMSNQTWMVTTFFPSNFVIAVNRFRNASLYPNLGAPVFSQFGGSVSNNYLLTLTHTNGVGSTIYYTLDGSDPRLKGGGISPGALTYSTGIALASPTLVRARVLKSSVWSALTEAQFHTPQDLSKLQLSEIMYNPPMFGTNDGDEVEFLELKNTGTNALDLSGLTFTRGIQFAFSNETQLGPGQFFVLARNAALFAAKYSNAPLNGLYSGKLENNGETLALSAPLGAQIFSITYDNNEPWPIEADNGGLSLQRMNFTVPATNARNWIAAAPTPGADLPAEFRDDDGDGMPNGWELAHGLNPDFNDAALDKDADGLTNFEEFLAGTNPEDENNRLALRATGSLPDAGGVVLNFLAQSNKSYSVLWRNSVESAGWLNLTNINAQPTNRFVTVTNQIPPGTASRFYRLATPRVP